MYTNTLTYNDKLASKISNLANIGTQNDFALGENKNVF